MADPAVKRLGHEASDISARVVVWFAATLVGSGGLIFLAVAGLHKAFEHQYPSLVPPSRIAFQPRMTAPPPQLQANPSIDLEQFQNAEEQKLGSYGWADKAGGVIRIPITRAMDLTVQRGLPTRGPGTQNESDKTPVQMQQEKATTTRP